MLKKLRQIIRSRPDAPKPSVPEGSRYYAVGDIHGRLDLFEALIKAIEEDDVKAGKAETHVILLGDLVDRGNDSAGVIAKARKWQKTRDVRILAGNHEEMFLDAFKEVDILRHFLKHGGRETIISYGISTKQFNSWSLEELFEELPDIVPKKDRKFLSELEDMIVVGDYLFVHAGIDPTRPLEKQKRSDLRWIRDRFLRHEGDFGKVVVHGHTIFPDIMDCGNRIGIDTGAFRSGILTALVLEGDQRRAIKAIESDGKIKISSEE